MGNRFPEPEPELLATIENFGLTKKQLGKLWRVFTTIDTDRSGALEINEWWELIREKPTQFATHIFDLLDTDTTGGLDYSEFVTTAVVFGMFSKKDMIKFCFQVFDTDKSGYIDEEELKTLVKMLHTSGVVVNIKKALYDYDQDKDGKISYDEFEHMCTIFPKLLFPAYRIQESIRKYTLGEKWYWEQSRKHADTKRKAYEAGRAQRITDEKQRQKDLELQRKREEEAIAREKARRGETNMQCCLCCAYDANAFLLEEEEEPEPEPERQKKVISLKAFNDNKLRVMPVNGDEMHEPEPDEVIVSGAPSRSEIRARRRALRQSKRDRAAREKQVSKSHQRSERQRRERIFDR